eukprot:3434761-Rhodomonas_salina.2
MLLPGKLLDELRSMPGAEVPLSYQPAPYAMPYSYTPTAYTSSIRAMLHYTMPSAGGGGRGWRRLEYGGATLAAPAEWRRRRWRGDEGGQAALADRGKAHGGTWCGHIGGAWGVGGARGHVLGDGCVVLTEAYGATRRMGSRWYGTRMTSKTRYWTPLSAYALSVLNAVAGPFVLFHSLSGTDNGVWY